MNNENNITLTRDDDRSAAIAWLRKSLLRTLEVAPLSEQPKKTTRRLLELMPDWFMATCADALNVDYIGGYRACPDFADQVRNNNYKYLAQQYLEAHDAMAVGNCLQQLVRKVIKLARAGRLPVDKEIVDRGVCALAFSGLTAEGMEFAWKARSILSEAESNNHVIIDYQIALESGKKDKLEEINAILTGGRYGEWINERLAEIRRYLGLDYPEFHINFSERTPQWDTLWENIIKGGTKTDEQ